MTDQRASKEIVASGPPKTITDLLKHEGWRNEIAGSMPKHCELDRFVNVVRATILRNPKLESCTISSISQCLRDCAALGMEPDVLLGRAYLIPYQNRSKQTVECQLIIGYRGLVELAYRSGKVKGIRAEVVHKKDKFVFELGLSPKLRHVPSLEDDPGPITHAYAVADLEGGIQQWTVMTNREILAIKNRSRAGHDGPWVTDFAEMAKKTVFRRLSKMLPLSTEFHDALSREDRSMESAGVFDRDPTTYECETCGARITARAAGLSKKAHGAMLCTACTPDTTPVRFDIEEEPAEDAPPAQETSEAPKAPETPPTPPPAKPAPKKTAPKKEAPAAPAKSSTPEHELVSCCAEHALNLKGHQEPMLVDPPDCPLCQAAVRKVDEDVQRGKPAPQKKPEAEGSPVIDQLASLLGRLKAAQAIRLFYSAGLQVPPEVDGELDLTSIEDENVAVLLKEAKKLGY